MMRISLFMGCLTLLLGISSCSSHNSAGKTTTTTNGIAVIFPSGKGVQGFEARLALGNLDSRGLPLEIQLLGTEDSLLALDPGSWALVQVMDLTGQWGALLSLVDLQDSIRTVTLAPIRHLQGALPPSMAGDTVVLSHSFARAIVDSLGNFSISGVIPDSCGIFATVGDSLVRLGNFHSQSDSVHFEVFSSPIHLSLDSTPVPSLMWLDNFEDANTLPLPGPWNKSPGWRFFTLDITFGIPSSTNSADMGQALSNGTLYATGTPTSAQAWMVFNLSLKDSLTVDLTPLDSLCFNYRADDGIKIELFELGHATSTTRRFFLNLRTAKPNWSSVCVALDSFTPDPANETGHSDWSTFAPKIHSMQFLSPSQGTVLGIDDVYLK